ALLIIGPAGLHRRADFAQQRLVLRGVKKSSPRIAMSLLPASDGLTGLFLEPSIDFGIESEPGQPALHVAALGPGQANLIFGLLICLLARACGVGRGGGF